MKNIRTLFCIGLFFITMTVNASIIMGNPKGNVTLVEVMSYQCIHCHNMQFVLETLQTETPALKMKIFPVANYHSYKRQVALPSQSRISHGLKLIIALY